MNLPGRCHRRDVFFSDNCYAAACRSLRYMQTPLDLSPRCNPKVKELLFNSIFERLCAQPSLQDSNWREGFLRDDKRYLNGMVKTIRQGETD